MATCRILNNRNDEGVNAFNTENEPMIGREQALCPQVTTMMLRLHSLNGHEPVNALNQKLASYPNNVYAGATTRGTCKNPGSVSRVSAATECRKLQVTETMQAAKYTLTTTAS